MTHLHTALPPAAAPSICFLFLKARIETEKTQTKEIIQSLLNAKNELMEVKPGDATWG